MTSRDRWLAALLPSMFTLLIGWFFLLRPAGRDATIMIDRASHLGPLQPREAAVHAARTEAEALARQLAARRTEAPPPDLPPFDRRQALQQVSHWCGDSGLSLISTAPLPNGQIPAALRDTAATIPPAGECPPAQLWKLELLGPYPAVTRLLEKMAAASPSIVPVTLSMEPGRTARQPGRWTLHLFL